MFFVVQGATYGEERDVLEVAEFLCVFLDSGAVSHLFLVDVDQEVEIVVDIMALVDVTIPTLAFSIDLKFGQTAYIALVLDVFLKSVALLSHTSKGIDDNTENKVENDHHDYEEEGQIEGHSAPEILSGLSV